MSIFLYMCHFATLSGAEGPYLRKLCVTAVFRYLSTFLNMIIIKYELIVMRTTG
jgi:hypothetical protein